MISLNLSWQYLALTSSDLRKTIICEAAWCSSILQDVQRCSFAPSTRHLLNLLGLCPLKTWTLQPRGQWEMDGAGMQPLPGREAGPACRGQRQTNETCRTGMQSPCLPDSSQRSGVFPVSAPNSRDRASICTLSVWGHRRQRHGGSVAGREAIDMVLFSFQNLLHILK